MPLEEIIFIIKPDGEIIEEVKGVKGKDCVHLTKEIEEKLGDVKERKHKGEYYEEVMEKDKVRSK